MKPVTGSGIGHSSRVVFHFAFLYKLLLANIHSYRPTRIFVLLQINCSVCRDGQIEGTGKTSEKVNCHSKNRAFELTKRQKMKGNEKTIWIERKAKKILLYVPVSVDKDWFLFLTNLVNSESFPKFVNLNYSTIKAVIWLRCSRIQQENYLQHDSTYS